MADIDSKLPIRQIHNRAASPDDDDLVFTPTGVQGTADNTVHAMDISLFDENGDAYSGANPLPVTMDASEGDEICDYQTTAALAKDASADHDYAVTAAKTFIGERLWASASGKIKVELKVETAPASATFNTIFVAFNSTASPNIDISLDKICGEQVASADLRVSITNIDNQAQDVYSTLVGIER